MRPHRAVAEVPCCRGPPVEELERGQLAGPLAATDPPWVVRRAAPPGLVVVEVVGARFVPVLGPLVQEAEEQPVVLRVSLLGLLGQEPEARPAEEAGEASVDAARGVDQDRGAPLDAQPPFSVVDVGPIVQQRQETARDGGVTSSPVQRPLNVGVGTGLSSNIVHPVYPSRLESNTPGPSREVEARRRIGAATGAEGQLAALEISLHYAGGVKVRRRAARRPAQWRHSRPLDS